MIEGIRQHKFTCDRCGRTETTDDRYSEYSGSCPVRPDGWKKYGGIDLCGRCSDDFDKFMDGKVVMALDLLAI